MNEPSSPHRLVPPGGRVCIIGGGTTGLLAAKNCLEEGLIPVVFERTAKVGGVWRLDDAPTRVAYRSLYTNSSGRLMCISDYPLDEALRDQFPGRQDICDYYEKYVHQFGLDQHIQFGAVVTAVRREASHWSIDVARESQPNQRMEFDAVFICSGQYTQPVVPELAGSETFKGRISHSAAFRDAAGMKGKRVVLIGIGNSALDISLECARMGCSSVTLLCRAGTNIIPVADSHGRPGDQMLNTRFYDSLPSSLKQLLFLRMIRGTNTAFRRHGMPKLPSNPKDIGFSNLKEHVLYRQMLEAGTIRLVEGEVKMLKEESVLLSTGEELGADEIILCVGYKLEFPFLDASLAQNFVVSTAGRRHLNAYKLVMHTSEPTLCALGFLSTYGNESCVAEMQARWSLAHWVGRAPLPSAESLDKELARRRKGHRYPSFKGYVSYMDDLAADCGVAPPVGWATLVRHPNLFLKLMLGPVVPAQYRLVGEHASPAAAAFVQSQPTVAQRWLEMLWFPPDSSSAQAAKPPASRL